MHPFRNRQPARHQPPHWPQFGQPAGDVLVDAQLVSARSHRLRKTRHVVEHLGQTNGAKALQPLGKGIPIKASAAGRGLQFLFDRVAIPRLHPVDPRVGESRLRGLHALNNSADLRRPGPPCGHRSSGVRRDVNA
ncbi:hypothetical protein GCM10009565_51990 [Amycolatopsis albidoflavus]